MRARTALLDEKIGKGFDERALSWNFGGEGIVMLWRLGIGRIS